MDTIVYIRLDCNRFNGSKPVYLRAVSLPPLGGLHIDRYEPDPKKRPQLMIDSYWSRVSSDDQRRVNNILAMQAVGLLEDGVVTFVTQEELPSPLPE